MLPYRTAEEWVLAACARRTDEKIKHLLRNHLITEGRGQQVLVGFKLRDNRFGICPVSVLAGVLESHSAILLSFIVSLFGFRSQNRFGPQRSVVLLNLLHLSFVPVRNDSSLVDRRENAMLNPLLAVLDNAFKFLKPYQLTPLKRRFPDALAAAA